MEIKKSDGSVKVVRGYQYEAPKAGSKQFKTKNNYKLPAKVDLRDSMTTVENQGPLSSCTANAVAGAYEYLVKKSTDLEYDVSRLFIYYNGRAVKNAANKDQGCVISNALNSLKEFGACSEEIWPYSEAKVNTKPSAEAYEEANQYIVTDYEYVPTDLNAWKQCLADGYPIVFGLSLFDSFDYQKKKGVVPEPTDKEQSRESHAGHAMLCVGYSDTDKLFIVRNSWGESWGDNGYCYIPYSYIMDERFNYADSWIIRNLDNYEFENDEESWSDDEESLLDDYETEFAEMSDEDYRNMIDEMGKYHIETRLGQLLLVAAGADGDVSEEELNSISEYLQKFMDAFGIMDVDPAKVIKFATKIIGKEEILDETIELFGRYFSSTLLASIINDVYEIAGIDELADEENDFVNMLVSTWQVEDEESEEESEEEYDESEEDEESEEEEYDEESEEEEE